VRLEDRIACMALQVLPSRVLQCVAMCCNVLQCVAVHIINGFTGATTRVGGATAC